jgi:hypothetical protein
LDKILQPPISGRSTQEKAVRITSHYWQAYSRIEDYELKERITTRISSEKSTSFYRLPSCGCYAVIDEIAFILPTKN